jgi:hypothetical protein
MSSRPYKKSRFSVVGIINIPNPPGKEGSYVLATCTDKPGYANDRDVIEDNDYTVFWEIDTEKCDAPSPPFNTGEGIGATEEEENKRIKYNRYCKARFKLIGKFNPVNTNKYPTPGNNGTYYSATCTDIHAEDKKVDKYSTYVIIVYPDSKFVDCPSPPFKNGDDNCSE